MNVERTRGPNDTHGKKLKRSTRTEHYIPGKWEFRKVNSTPLGDPGWGASLDSGIYGWLNCGRSSVVLCLRCVLIPIALSTLVSFSNLLVEWHTSPERSLSPSLIVHDNHHDSLEQDRTTAGWKGLFIRRQRYWYSSKETSENVTNLDDICVSGLWRIRRTWTPASDEILDQLRNGTVLWWYVFRIDCETIVDLAITRIRERCHWTRCVGSYLIPRTHRLRCTTLL